MERGGGGSYDGYNRERDYNREREYGRERERGGYNDYDGGNGNGGGGGGGEGDGEKFAEAFTDKEVLKVYIS